MRLLPRLFRSLLPALALTLGVLGGCSDYQPPSNPGDSQRTMKTTVVGLVVDDAGRGVSGASVTLHGATTTTDGDGVFTFVDATIPSERALVQAHAAGYFTSSRGFLPGAAGSTVRLTLANRPLAGTVSAQSGGTVNVGNGASVTLPAAGIVRADGTPYTGTVRVMARAWKPGDADFNNCFPGDARARGTNGELSLLVSLGFQTVELEDGSGNELKLGNGARATLSYTIPAAMQSVAPNRIPLWYFDEAKGLWIEEGEAVRQGNVYTGQVSHFTPWNCDWPGGFGKICGTVKACGEDPAAGVVVNVGPVQTMTDEAGNFCAEVAAGWSAPFDIYAEGSTGIASNHVTVATVAQGQTVSVQLDMTAVAVVRARLVDCDGQPTSGVVRVSWDGAIQSVIYAQNGNFVVGLPVGKPATLSTLNSQLSVPAQSACNLYNAGDLATCNNGQGDDQVIDWSLKINNGTPSVMQSGSVSGMMPGGAVLRSDNLLTITAQGAANSTPAELRIHVRGVTGPGTYVLGVFNTDPGVGVFEIQNSGHLERWSTDRDSSNVRDSIATPSPGILTITGMTADRIEGSFSFTVQGWQARYGLVGSFIGVRKP